MGNSIGWCGGFGTKTHGEVEEIGKFDPTIVVEVADQGDGQTACCTGCGCAGVFILLAAEIGDGGDADDMIVSAGIWDVDLRVIGVGEFDSRPSEMCDEDVPLGIWIELR